MVARRYRYLVRSEASGCFGKYAFSKILYVLGENSRIERDISYYWYYNENTFFLLMIGPIIFQVSIKITDTIMYSVSDHTSRLEGSKTEDLLHWQEKRV